ncbi:MAG: UDP-N-acetylmuramate--L-alanine ligase [Bacteroidales bacterium]|nr:UDP-N-acetylmuramate--L-alanine ligase [Candidatus Liminaster caballi]
MATYKNIYFVGAGGIGMSALERYFNENGYKVGGYDKTPSPLTETLIKEGIQIHFEDNIDAVDAAFKDPEQTLVCYTPAIPKDHGELCFFQQNGFEVVKRSKLLGIITQTKRGLCFSGTHGKTTTSSMAAHLLKQSHVDCNAFLGGILKPYDSNLMLSARNADGQEKSDLTVIEADEFDRSFHTLSPYMAVITSCDPDHLDIYGTEEAYRESFAHFVSLVRPGGFLLKHKGVNVDCSRLNSEARYAEYSSTEEADYYATNIRIGGGTILFDYVARAEGITMRDLEVGVPVPINVDNAVASLTIAMLCGCEEEELRAALKSFGGAKRRFDFYIKRQDLVLMDDYAHHPDEIRASLTSVARLFEGRKVTVCFQPHLYSRTHDLVDGFASALSIPQRTILLPIYPAREQPIPGVTSEWLLGKIQDTDKALGKNDAERYIKTKDELVGHLTELRKKGDLDVVVMMGAGVDIERLVAPAKAALE